MPLLNLTMQHGRTSKSPAVTLEDSCAGPGTVQTDDPAG
jgi:hypothetical protein